MHSFPIISTATAQALGINPANATDAIDLSGIAGTVTVPMVNVDSLAVKTTENVNLAWTGLQFGVYDIDPSIAGIFGMDFLTSGWFAALFGGPDGYLNGVHFDFRDFAQNVGTMVLDVNPALNNVVVPGDTNHDGVVNGLDISQVASHWLKSGAGLPGDVNGDGTVNGLDIALIASNWLSAAPPGKYPRRGRRARTCRLDSLGDRSHDGPHSTPAAIVASYLRRVRASRLSVIPAVGWQSPEPARRANRESGVQIGTGKLAFLGVSTSRLI